MWRSLPKAQSRFVDMDLEAFRFEVLAVSGRDCAASGSIALGDRLKSCRFHAL